uniref:Uncharacterized protein n=1 Tax=Arcella intermedia TaxID=1963864 RepID=A0A6B2L497_9EUKA
MNEEIRSFTNKYKNIHVTRMPIEQGIEEDHKNYLFQFNGRYLEEELSFPKNEYDILYIGEQDPTLTNLVMAWNSSKVYTYSPKTEQFRSEILPVNRLLQQRYFMIEKVKQSNIIGILVGTLAGVKYLEMLEYMKKVITEAGKKYYIIVVGKINLPKLANFSDIEIFVLLAGVESSLIDPREFYRPVVTPFELEIALVRGKEWTTDYKIDFNDVLKYSDVKEYNEEDETEDPYYQTITGTIVANPKAKAKTEEGSLAITAAQSSQIQAYSVQKLFLERSFKGLEMKIGETPVTLAVEGKTGIPNKGYVTANTDNPTPDNKL